ncbi:MAG: hypothetical protein GQ574_14310 [Crocinitomix sp.]|nr:hypothetical protein [Crocinitomix sp.]
MKRIQQKILYFKEGNSDKIYEVDLCETGNDLFVVNFRYGRRESVLRDGTKTIFPVGYDEALKVFDKLVNSKVKKGYSESGEEVKPTEQSKILEPRENTARDETILRYLKEGAAGSYTRNWKISKVILRAGILNLKEAAPLIHPFVLSKDEFEGYAAIKTLALFDDNSAVKNVYSVYAEFGLENKVGRIAAAYLLKFKANNYHTEIVRTVKQKLPSEIAGQLNNPDAFLGALAMYYMQADGVNPMTLYYLYLISSEQPNLRKPLFEFVNNCALKVNTFKSIRYIFRTAELLDDLEFFALIAKKIGVSYPGHNQTYTRDNDQWILASDEMKKKNPSIAFGKNTQLYFIHNIYKYIRRLSQESAKQYISIATQFLCLLDNEKDQAVSVTKHFYDYNYTTQNYLLIKRQFPRYNKFSALMYILFGAGERLKRTKTKWYYDGEVIALKDLGREEILAAEWDKHPQEVLTILAHSKSEEATAFSFRILKANSEFLDQANGKLMNQLVGNADSEVVNFLIAYLEEKYKDEQAPADLVLALFEATNEVAAKLAKVWLEKYESAYLGDTNFIIALLLSGNLATLHFLQTVYKEKVAYPHQIELDKIQALFAVKSSYTPEYLIAVGYLFGNPNFTQLLYNVTMDDILNLVRDERPEIIIIAANLCKKEPTWIYAIFKERVQNYIESENADLRKLGIEILGHFPNDYLTGNSHQIGKYYFSEYQEVRAAIQPAMARLIELDNAFKKAIFKESMQTLLEPETYDGLHETIYELLTEQYQAQLKSIELDAVIELILAKYNFAQLLGTPLFRKFIQIPNFTMAQLVRLAKSDVREVRDFLPVYFEQNKVRINNELEIALHIFHSEWKDVFDWSFTYFENEIQPEKWTIDLLLYICDHIKPEVQAFGKRLVLTHFTENKGLDLLLKLQEHPSKGMQFFATNYLDNYAKDKPEVILQLKGFFKSILFNINENRATKTRVFAFLEQETIKSEVVANMIVDLVNGILTTETRIDQSHCIDLLLTVAEVHPHIQIPITVKEI